MATVDSITNPDKMFEDAGIKVIVGKVVQADPVNKILMLADGSTIHFDKLILGLGARQMVSPLEGSTLKGVFTLRTAADAMRIRDYFEAENPRKLVFIGAGYTNLETASLLMTSKPDYYRATVIELMPYPLPLMLDRDLALGVQDYLEAKGLQMKMGEKASRVLGKNGQVSGVELTSGEQIPGDLVLIAVGAAPNLELAQQLDLAIEKFGIRVNEFLETSQPDILAGGDCVEKFHVITKKPVLSMLRGTAVIQGRLMAKRLAGYAIPFPGVLNNSAVRLFDKYYASVGLTEDGARQEGFEALAVSASSRSKHGMIPGVKPWTLKLVFDRKTQKLLGGQIVADSEAPVKEIDTINALILGGKTIPDLTVLMCAGTPDCSSEPSLEPITICAEQALQKLSA
ncbi:MAG: NAD(P)/FAD-dependent oxidoreductase [Thermodesulfobacteriota bacterium]